MLLLLKIVHKTRTRLDAKNLRQLFPSRATTTIPQLKAWWRVKKKKKPSRLSLSQPPSSSSVRLKQQRGRGAGGSGGYRYAGQEGIIPLFLLRSAMLRRLWFAPRLLLASFLRRSRNVSNVWPWPLGRPTTLPLRSGRMLEENREKMEGVNFNRTQLFEWQKHQLRSKTESSSRNWNETWTPSYWTVSAKTNRDVSGKSWWNDIWFSFCLVR